MSKTTNEDLDRVLAYLDGYEEQTHPVEVPPSILTDAHFHLWNLAKECAALRADAEALRFRAESYWKVIEDAMPYIPCSSFVAGEIDAICTERTKEKR